MCPFDLSVLYPAVNFQSKFRGHVPELQPQFIFLFGFLCTLAHGKLCGGASRKLSQR